MNFLTFHYTKEDGTSSDRVILPLREPTPNYFGIDVSELSLEDQVDFSEKLRRLKESHNAEINKLMAEFDVRQNFRSFKPERMSNIIKE